MRFKSLMSTAAAALVAGWSTASIAQVVVNDDAGGNTNEPAPCDDPPDHTTIAAGVGDADAPPDPVLVCPGVYDENVSIEKSVLTLISVGGWPVTIVEGQSEVGSPGTVVIEPDTDNVQVGDVGQGFTLIGIDNGLPGIENAALYFDDDHDGATVVGNKIVANGEHGLATEVGATNSNFLIELNEFAGKTFIGNSPGGCGFGDQFTEPNVPRQLAVISGGFGGGNHSDITFTDNVVTGTAGGPNPDCVNNGEQGNTLVTIDAARATIDENIFAGTTARFGTELRARGPDTVIRGNSFRSDGLSDFNCYVFIQEITSTLGAVRGQNTFDTRAVVDPGPNATTGSICPGLRIPGS